MLRLKFERVIFFVLLYFLHKSLTRRARVVARGNLFSSCYLFIQKDNAFDDSFRIIKIELNFD